MRIGIYISHPEVEIKPEMPVGTWGLNEVGGRRARQFAKRNLLPEFAPIYSSTEKKALELAEILAEATRSEIIARAEFDENDRSSTGYLAPALFERRVKQLFAAPGQSIAGWETAVGAQTRIVGAVARSLMDHPPDRPVIFAGHGCVGTLLKCHYGGREIKQSEDQRQVAHPGGGNVFVFDPLHHKLLCDWTAMEDWSGI